MADRSHIHRHGVFRCRLESEVANALAELGHSATYESDKFVYYLKKRYKPDFKIGDVYIEVKGWWPAAERSKFLAVVVNNPDLRIFVALQNPNIKLSKKSKTTYAQWCEKHGIAWCPIPIPPDFIQSWLSGSRCTFRAQHPTAKAATAHRSVQMEAFTASSATRTSPKMANLGSNETT